ncbi:MAG: hypothetical protein V1810_03455 [Candidatus Beckwithbacteria bacterium]
MLLPKQAIKEDQEIYFKEFGEKISYDEAQKQGLNFLMLLKLISQPTKVPIKSHQ